MTLHKLSPLAGLTLAAACMSGCCNLCNRPPVVIINKNLPAPISAEEQTQRLNARAGAIPFLVANTDGLDIRWIDKNSGKEKHENPDSGRLLIRQHQTADSRHAGDILLTGNALGQAALEIGKNDKNWWYALYLGDSKGAHVGDVDAAPNPALAGNEMLRGDIHLQLLGISPLVINPGSLIAMQVDDLQGKNRLFIEHMTAAGFAQIERELVINRFTGQIEEVDLYDNAGSLLARSSLQNYQPITYTHGATGTSPPLVPTLIDIDFPSMKASVRLKLSDMEIPDSIPDFSFELPDFKDQGLKVEHDN